MAICIGTFVRSWNCCWSCWTTRYIDNVGEVRGCLLKLQNFVQISGAVSEEELEKGKENLVNIAMCSVEILFISPSRVKDTLGPHIDASLLCWQRAVVVLPRSCWCLSNLVRCLSSSFVVFQAFSLYRLYPSVQLVLAVCCRPFAERARAISVFSLLWWDLSSPVVSAPWPSRYWLSFH